MNWNVWATWHQPMWYISWAHSVHTPRICSPNSITKHAMLSHAWNSWMTVSIDWRQRLHNWMLSKKVLITISITVSCMIVVERVGSAIFYDLYYVPCSFSTSVTGWRSKRVVIHCRWCQVFTAWCTLVQSAVLRSHVVCLSVCLSVCNVGELWSHRLEFFENNFTIS